MPGWSDPSEDNMLKITSDGRKLGLDQRILNPLLPDDPSTARSTSAWTTSCASGGRAKADKLTQLVFSDLSTPRRRRAFTVYEDIRRKLIAAGVPEEEIAFIHDANTEVEKEGAVRQSALPVRCGC